MTPAQRARLGYNTHSDLDIPGTSTDIMYMTQFVLKLDLEEVLGKTSPSGLATLAVVSRQTMATHGHGSKSTAPSDRPTVQNHSLLDTLLEGRIDKRMTAYSNKFTIEAVPNSFWYHSGPQAQKKRTRQVPALMFGFLQIEWAHLISHFDIPGSLKKLQPKFTRLWASSITTVPYDFMDDDFSGFHFPIDSLGVTMQPPSPQPSVTDPTPQAYHHPLQQHISLMSQTLMLFSNLTSPPTHKSLEKTRKKAMTTWRRCRACFTSVTANAPA
ncbi:hypothetical protein D6C82_08371 [Aureobasidium pullulans]|nr:hypothetical protein D6C82_08371 [Aureobasidium pullulans]